MAGGKVLRLAGIALALLASTGCDDPVRRRDGAVDGPSADGPVLQCPPVDRQKSCAAGRCTIPAGCFDMGAPAGELCRESDEVLHRVQLRHRLDIGDNEVTQQSFQQLMGYSPSSFASCGADCPVENVSWHEAAAYCNALSKAENKAACYDCTGSGAAVTCGVAAAFATGGKTDYDCPGFRLPFEAEWEYAARSSTETALCNGPVTSCLEADPGADAIAWYKANSSEQTHKVAQKASNGWGLCDMSGNVWEWTADWYTDAIPAQAAIDPLGPQTGIARTVRGGSFSSTPNKLRHAYRTQQALEYRSKELGFRCVRSLP